MECFAPKRSEVLDEENKWRVVRIYQVLNRVLFTSAGRHFMTQSQFENFNNRAEQPEKFWMRNEYITFDRPLDFVEDPEQH